MPMMTAQTQSSLELPETPAEVKRYQRSKLAASLVSTILELAVLASFGIWFGPDLGRALRDSLGEQDWLCMYSMALIVGLVLEIVALPFAFWSGFVLEHRHDLSNQTLAGWIKQRLKSYLVGGIIGCILISGLYVLLWMAGSAWWLWASAGWLLVTLVLGQLMPVLILPLFYNVTRLGDPSLASRLRALAQGSGLNIEGVYRLHMSRETRKANAALAGLGRTRRVLLGDTLLDQFSPEEIEIVFAHELGHHVHHHIPKGIVISVILAGAGFWLVDRVLNAWAGSIGYNGIGDPAALPLVLLVLALFSLTLVPAQNALSRLFERQCDRYALERTGSIEAYRSAFIKLARINKSDPDPNPLVVWLFYDHPPIRKRLAMTERG
jgi:STE24 endopeptidase